MKNGAGNGTSKEEKAMCRENLKAAAESLKAGAAKCALMADEICSNYTVAKPLLGGLEKSVTAICAVCYTLQASTYDLKSAAFLKDQEASSTLSLSAKSRMLGDMVWNVECLQSKASANEH